MKVAIVGNMRTGTTVINETLGRHSQLNLTHEILHPSDSGGNVRWRTNYWPNDLFRTKDINNLNNLETYHNILSEVLDLYDGFKVVYYQLEAKSKLWNYIESRCKIIHVLRENKVEIAVSSALAESTGRWQRSPGETWKDEPIDINPDWLAIHVSRSERWEEEYRKRFPDALEIHYEDFGNWDDTINKILDFLELPRETLPPTLRKRTQPLHEVVANYELLASDKRFQRYLQQPLKYFL